MIKAIKKNLSIKIFLITAVLLILACSGTFFCISQILPSTYSHELNQNMMESVTTLLEELSEQETLEDCYILISRFAKSEDAAVWIKSVEAEENVIYSIGNTQISENKNDGVQRSNHFLFSLKNGASSYILVVQADMKAVDQVMEVFTSIVPYVLVIVLVLSLFCSVFYSLYITRPIIRLSTISENMAELEFSERCNESREDELGVLARNLNRLSNSLSEAMTELKAANEQLKSDMEKEREAERKKMDFFAAASHELKTPLTVLKGHLSGMLDEVGGYQDHKKYLNRSLKVTEQMEMLVKELLFISRKESDKHTASFKKADLSEVIRSQLAELTDLFVSKQLALDLKMPEQVLCMMDSQLMKRAIRNIIVNAIQYSPAGEHIRIEVTENDEKITCSFENTGVHIPEYAISHLFDAFYRADRSRNKDTGGTGLGLYIVRGILEEHNAEYVIQNTTEGVKFTFHLPKNSL